MTTALFETEVGNINIEFFSDDAPNTVKNFTNLISDGFYDGLAFHRVIPGFMAQGGCPNTRDGASGMPGTGGLDIILNVKLIPITSKRLTFYGSCRKGYRW